MDPWQWARDAWELHFEPLSAAGYELERVDGDTYWQTHERDMRVHFNQEIYFNTPGLRDDHEREGQQRIAESTGGRPLRDFCIVRRSGALAAMFCGEQRTPAIYRMWHSHVHPAHRRRGLYSQILHGVIAYTRALGFDGIDSEHAPCNNPILIAKLKAGFRIWSLEIDPMAGMSIRLRYFHNADHLAAYEFRCGLASLNPRIVDRGSGAVQTLRTQLAGESDR